LLLLGARDVGDGDDVGDVEHPQWFPFVIDDRQFADPFPFEDFDRFDQE
jgi:hypothetical protein